MTKIFELLQNVNPLYIKIVIAVIVILIILSIIKKFMRLTVVCVVFALIFGIIAPSVDTLSKYNVNISEKAVTFTYDGNEQSISIDSIKNGYVKVVEAGSGLKEIILDNGEHIEVPSQLGSIIEKLSD